MSETTHPIPRDVRLITWATSVRFFGWGFAEMFIPILLLSFAHNFLGTGILLSVYDVVFLLSIPVVAYLANYFSGKKIILWGLVLYPLVSLGYFLGGIWGALIFIILARAINGISYSLDSIGKFTYIRRHSEGKVATLIGYLDTLSNLWWIVAAFIGVWLLNYISLPYLFLLIIPTVLIAILFIMRLGDEPVHQKLPRDGFLGLKTIFRGYFSMFSYMWKWNQEQSYVGILYFFTMSVSILISFFVPVVSFAEGASYLRVVLLTTFAILPVLFSMPLGAVADRAGKRSVIYTLIATLCLLVILSRTNTLALTYIEVFCIGMCTQYLFLLYERIGTLHSRMKTMGSLSGAFEGITELSSVVTPIALGFMIDKVNFPFAILFVACIGIVLLLPLALTRMKLLPQK